MEAFRRPQPESEPFSDAADHLAFELGRLEILLARQVLRLRAAHRLADDPFRGLYISDAQVDALLSGEGPDAVPDDAGAQGLTRRLEEAGRLRDQRLAASYSASIELPLARLAALFDLDRFEEEVVLLALAPEVDRRYETLCAYVQNDVTRRRPTVGLALDLLCDTFPHRLAARTAFGPEGRLLRHRLLHLVDDPQEREPALPGRALRLAERVSGYLLGDGSLDESLLPFVERVEEPPDLAGLALPAGLTGELARAAGLIDGGGVLLLHGPRGAGKRRLAAALAAGLGRPLLAADLRILAGVEGRLDPTLEALAREAVLRGAALLLEHLEAPTSPAAGSDGKAPGLAALCRALARPSFPVFLAGEEAWEPATPWTETPFLAFAVTAPPAHQRLALWRRAAADCGAAVAADDLADAAGKFALTPGQITGAVRRAAHRAAVRGASGPTAADLHAGARAQSSQGLTRLAQKVETSYDWDDLVLPRRPAQQLREIHAAVRHRGRVLGEWGFGAKLAGKGLNVLFAGPSGTGKTMAASILAGELGLDLYRIDLAGVVSKYIGETEKNLARVFREAECSNAVLFFDEADALFGKRSEVKDSHDRYANIETAYLLQRMEEYEGISILATNLRKNLDDAFARRLQHTVEFPFPDAAHRERIWRRAFPTAAPLADDVDLPFLAQQFELAGGNIRNVALAAAFLAAEEGTALAMRHLILAVARELAKLGKLPTRSEFQQHYGLIREGG